MKRRIFITGGTGFLGRHLAKRLMNDYEVLLSGRNNKQNLQAEKMTGCQVVPCDVTNIESVRDALVSFQPHIVVHAAATKFVDRAEKEPMECIDVNVLGSQNVIRASLQCGVDTCIGISTDKAAPPVRNIYGLSKAVMERAFCGMNGKTKTKLLCARYGNVAWSTGSVLPIWNEMHEKTKVIGTTGPDMTRFFFTVHEAVQLIVTSIENIDELQGQVLSRMMKAAKIRDILDVWIAEKGGRWEQITGRPGERDLEYLLGETELAYTTEKMYNGVAHFAISFNEKSKRPVQEVIHSNNVMKLNRDEIINLINFKSEEM